MEINEECDFQKRKITIDLANKCNLRHTMPQIEGKNYYLDLNTDIGQQLTIHFSYTSKYMFDITENIHRINTQSRNQLSEQRQRKYIVLN